MSSERSRALLPVVMLALGLSSWAFASGGDGFWQVTSGGGICPPNQVCADWFQDGLYIQTCCIPEEKLSSSEPDVCTGAEPQPPEDPTIRDRNT